MIELKDWKWRGLPGHFCAVEDCLFRLCTDVGSYKISTVGAWYPRHRKQEKMETIGLNRHYETFVFSQDAGEILDIGRVIDSDHVECTDFENPEKFDAMAESMHIKMCLKYAEMQ